ncbi:MAG: hypothetical protein KDB74_07560 [Flavobacteriales bacterium]|nr:hypothetical protein [Flavobacteriales bacterium]
MKEFKLKSSLEGHQGALYAMCHAENEHQFYSAGADHKVVLWDISSQKPVKVVAKSATTVISLAYLRNENLLLIGQVEGGLHLIDLAAGAEIKYLKIHKGYIFDIFFIASKNELVLCSGDGSFSVWSVPTFKLLLHEQVCSKKIRSVDVCLERNEVCFALGTGEILFYNLNDWTKKLSIDNEGVPVNKVKYIANQRLLFGDKNAHLGEIDLGVFKVANKIPGHNWAIYDISQGEDKSIFATASRDKTVKIWDAEEMKVLKRFEGMKDLAHTHSVNKLLWSKFENNLLSTGDDGKIKIWQIP